MVNGGFQPGNYPELFVRYRGNPILAAEDWPYQANAVFNAAASSFNGETLLLARVEDMRGLSHLAIARSKDGFTQWQIDEKPTLLPDVEHYPEEIWGIEDPRVVFLEELEQYAIVYTSFSECGPLVCLALTRDFKVFRRKGAIMPPEDKDASLFPRRFGNRWILLHRPMPYARAKGVHIWISYSPDLLHWGEHKILFKSRRGGWWDSNKIGLSTPPIETDEGWLIIYHGVRETAAGSLYRIGLALLDLENPEKVIHRSNQWVFGPRELYERIGDVADVTFPCGAIYDKAEDRLRLYYGAADSCLAVATAKMSDLLQFLKSGG